MRKWGLGEVSGLSRVKITDKWSTHLRTQVFQLWTEHQSNAGSFHSAVIVQSLTLDPFVSLNHDHFMVETCVPVSCLHYLSCVRKIWWGNRTPHCPLTPFTRPSRLAVFKIFLWWHQRVFGDWTSWRTYSRDFGQRSGNWALTLNPSESRVILQTL